MARHEERWWEGTIESRKGSKARIKLTSSGEDAAVEVKVASLRPRFVWLGWDEGWGMRPVYRA